MEFRKIVMITLYAEQKKRHRCIEQNFGLYGKRRGWMIWENSIETCILLYIEIDHQSRFDAWDRVLSAGALGWPWGMGWGGRWEGFSGWGTHVNPWLIHVNVWQKPLQYYKIISLQLIKINEKEKELRKYPYIHMNQPWVYMFSPSWTSLPPSSSSHPSGSSQCISPEHPSWTGNLFHIW